MIYKVEFEYWKPQGGDEEFDKDNVESETLTVNAKTGEHALEKVKKFVNKRWEYQYNKNKTKLIKKYDKFVSMESVIPIVNLDIR